MAMTDTDLALIRDEVGDEPDDTSVENVFDVVGHWLPTAIRILKRRRANAGAGGQEVSSFGLDGVMTVGLSKADLKGLDTQILRLEGQWANLNSEPDPTVATNARIGRADRYR